MSSPTLETSVQAQPLTLESLATNTSLALANSNVAGIALLTPLVLLVHGYHPFADDAGIYVAGIEKMMHPGLFRQDAAFVLAHTRISIFSHIFAGALQLSRIPLEIGLFVAYLASIFTFLFGCLRLSRRIFSSVHLQWGAVLLASVVFTIPVAATALSLMDPYVTARSFSTPFSLFALTSCIDRKWKSAALWFVLIAAIHPLMAAYLATFLLTYILVDSRRWRLLAAACIAGFLAASVIYFATIHAPLPDGYLEAVLTRQYFFLSNWHWYELLGLVMPLLLMLLAAWRNNRGSTLFNLCVTCVAIGTTASLCVACFVHTDGSFFLARIQLLRSFQLIYVVGVLLFGGFLAKYLSGPRAWMGASLLLLVSALMLFVQNQSFTASAHVEWPFATPPNPWQQAFLWIRYNTPQNAVFVIDPYYTGAGSEDTQGFRATAQRSALADELKDGGVVAVFPALAPQWKRERDLVLGLDRISDQERIRRLRPMGVTWLLLSANAATQFPCPFRNSVAAVCRLP